MPAKTSVSTNRDVVIIGGGHNGLVTAFYLAKAGFKPLVLERRAQPGGAAITEEFHPGFRCSTLAHSAGPVRPDIVRDMQLAKHGLNMITPEVEVTALTPDGRALVLYRDAEKCAQEIADFSQKDAAKYPQFQASLARMGRVIGKALALAPPNIDNPSSGDLWGMLNTGRAVRKLGRRDMYRLLRWGRWRWPTWWQSISRPSFCGPRLLPAASSEHFLDRGQQGAVSYFSCVPPPMSIPPARHGSPPAAWAL